MVHEQLTTKSRLVADLHGAGIVRGDVLLVHTSLSELGFVPGAGRTVIEALLEAVGSSGSVMMPTYSGELSDPAEWRYPPVPESWVRPILDETPPYDPQLTPTRKMGVVAELFRHFPGVRRSAHPQSSFAAWGAYADSLVAEHPLDFRFGPSSPLGKLCAVGGKVLLLGAPPQTCSLFYLTQSSMPDCVEITRRAPVVRDGKAVWVSYKDVEYPNAWFIDACNYLCSAGIMQQVQIGAAKSYVGSASASVAALVPWRLEHRV